MHLGKFPDRTEFQCWRVNFRTEVCSKAKNPCLALQWAKEIQTAKSLDDFITPKSITGKNSPDCQEMALMVAAALKKCYDNHTHTSVRKQVSKSSELRRTIDFSEGDKFLIWYMILFVQQDLMMRFKAYRECSTFDWKNGHIQDFGFAMGTSIVINKWSTIGQHFGRSENLKIAEFFSNPNDYGTIQSRNYSRRKRTRFFTDWECAWDCILSKLRKVRISGFNTKLQSEEPWPKERDKILSQSGRQENVFSGKQMGLVRKDSLVVFYMRLPRATASQHKKKFEAQVDLAKSMPRETVCSEERIKNKHPLLHRKWRNTLTYNARTVDVRVLKRELESLVYGEQNAKDRHVVVCILPCASATSLKADAVLANVANMDVLMLRRSPSSCVS